MRKIIALGAGVALALAPALAVAQSGGAQPGGAQPGRAPSGGAQSGQSPLSAPSAAAIPDATISKAGAALHDVAQVNQKYMGEMQKASPAQKQTLSEQANAEAVQAIQSHGLSVEQYAGVIQTARNDPQVKQRLLSAANQGQ